MRKSNRSLRLRLSSGSASERGADDRFLSSAGWQTTATLCHVWHHQSMAGRGFEILEHPADIGFRVHADTLPELFANAAMAMLSIAGDPAAATPLEQYRLAVESPDLDSLMVDWLSEVLYWYDGKRIAFRGFRVTRFEDTAIEAVGEGEPRDPERHRARLIVKAVTWHQLKIGRREGGWMAEVYLDI
jgi:SHS2 domain-containing protein